MEYVLVERIIEMKVSKFEFEGTSEEFRSVASLFGDKSLPDLSSQSKNASNQEENFVMDPKEAIRRMLKRRPVPKGQKDIYKALANGEVRSENMAKIIGRTASEYAGVMGALGRRINSTEEIHLAGLPANVYAVIKYRDTDDGTYLSLTHDAEEVLREEGLIEG